MAMTEHDRLRLRQRLTETIGEDAATTLMEAIPPVDYDQLATKDALALLGREVRSDIVELRGEMHLRFAEIETRFAAVDQRFADVDTRFAAIDQRFADVDARFAEVDARFADAEVARAHNLKVTVATNIGTMVGLAGLLLGFG